MCGLLIVDYCSSFAGRLLFILLFVVCSLVAVCRMFFVVCVFKVCCLLFVVVVVLLLGVESCCNVCCLLCNICWLLKAVRCLFLVYGLLFVVCLLVVVCRVFFEGCFLLLYFVVWCLLSAVC